MDVGEISEVEDDDRLPDRSPGYTAGLHPSPRSHGVASLAMILLESSAAIGEL